MLWQLIVLETGRRLPLEKTSSVLGSGSKCALRIEHPTVSRQHARLTAQGDRIVIEDLGSSNGTRIDGQLIRSPVEVGETTRVEFGMLGAELRKLDKGEAGAAVKLSGESAGPRRRPAPAGDPFTLVSEGSSRFAIEAFPELLECARANPDVTRLAAQMHALLRRHFDALAFCLEADRGQVLAGRSIESDAHIDHHTTGRFRVCVHGPRHQRVNAGPAMMLCAGLLDLVDRIGSAEATKTAAPPDRSSLAQRPEPATVNRDVIEIYDRAERVASSPLNVLIQGETGTGKELLAHFLHAASGRKGEFVAVNCAALSRDLLEAELFGIEAGVATGVSAREGRFVQADGGTLLLDEVTEMPDDCQAKLLRVLQEHEVVPVGARGPRAVDVRILAATNREVSTRSDGLGPLRPDLVHRLAGWTVRLPSLRARTEDIPQLAGHFFARSAREARRQPAGISHSAMDALCAYDWPGNVRELEQEMQRAALFVDEGELMTRRHLSPDIAGSRTATAELQDVSANAERQAIEQALASQDGNATKTAEALGISRATLYRRMKALDVER